MELVEFVGEMNNKYLDRIILKRLFSCTNHPTTSLGDRREAGVYWWCVQTFVSFSLLVSLSFVTQFGNSLPGQTREKIKTSEKYCKSDFLKVT